MADKQDSYITGDNAADVSIRGNYWAGQSFITNKEYRIESVILRLYKGVVADGLPEGNPGDITVSIRLLGADLKPTGGDLTSGTTSGDSLPTGYGAGYEWREIDLTPYLLTGSTKYAIIIRALAGDNTNYVKWRIDNTGGFGNGTYLKTLGDIEVWYVSSGYDAMFETWGSVMYEENDTRTGTDGNLYKAIIDHPESPDTIPITGDDWEDYWRLASAAVQDPAIWFSEVGDFDDFEAGLKDADSFSLTIPATNEVRWIESLEALLVGTSGGEWEVASNKFDTPITPTNFTVKQQSNYGSRNIQPAKVNEQILFVDYVGRKVRELTYSDSMQKFVAPDMTALAEHITLSGIVCIAHQRNPDSILWCVLDNGDLISMTYEREQNVVGWSKHPIDGDVQSVSITPSADEDRISLSVLRDETVTYEGETVTYEDETVTYGIVYIEKMMPRIFGAELEDAFFVDSGITVTNTPASTTIAGLGHLVGKTVAVLGDGVVYTPTAVVDGSGEVEISTAVKKAQVGLAFTYKLEPMRPDVSGPGGTTHGSIVKVPEMGISFLNTMNAKYGVDDDALFDVDWTNARWKNNTEITGLFTGDVVVVVNGGFTLENNLIISGSDPLPATVRCLVPKLEQTGR